MADYKLTVDLKIVDLPNEFPVTISSYNMVCKDCRGSIILSIDTFVLGDIQSSEIEVDAASLAVNHCGMVF